MKKLACVRQDRERPTQMVLAFLLHVPTKDIHLMVFMVDRCCRSGFSGQTLREDSTCLHGDNPKGLECHWAATGVVCLIESGSTIGPHCLHLHERGHDSAIAASFSACSEQAQLCFQELWSAQVLIGFLHVEAGLKSEPIPGDCRNSADLQTAL